MKLQNEYTGAFESGFAAVGGNGRLYYERMGVGTPIVLVHGFALDTRMWNGIFEQLAERFQVIRFDMRGFGQSPTTDDPFSVYEDIRGLLDGLGVESAFLVGHSLGGSLSLEFVCAYPERVRGLILTGSGLTGYQSQSDVLKQTQARARELYETAGLEAYIAYDLETLLDGPLAEPGRVQGALRESLLEIRRHAFSLPFNGNYPKRLEPAPLERLEEIQVPVLTQYGDLDWPEFKEFSDQIVARVPNAKQVLFEGTAHQGCMERPEEFAQLVVEFIQSVE